MKRSFLLFFLLATVSIIKAQDKQTFKTDFEEANLLLEEKFFQKSLDIWLTLDRDFPDNANVNYKIGYCYLQLNTARADALPYLIKASTSVKKNYDPFFSGETNAPAIAYYYLGYAYHLDHQFDKAIESFKTFQDVAEKKHYLYQDSFRQIDMANKAKELISDPVSINVINLGDNINSPYSDFSPVLSIDEQVLYFTSRRLREDSTNEDYTSDVDGKYFEDIYVSYKDSNNDWGQAKRLDFYFDDGLEKEQERNEATISASADGQLLFIYKDDMGDGNIYKSEQYGETWSNPEKMPAPINTKSWETHITMSADGNTLFFVSDRPGGLGGRDIYRTVKMPDGSWSKALNLGAPINTPYDEDAPYLHPDGKTMYFSSNGHGSMGGFDIFETIYDKETNTWSTPTNMGYPINSVDDDVFFVLSADGKRAYFSSASEKGFGEKDLYMAEIEAPEKSVTIIKGVISQEGGSVPDNLDIYVTDIDGESDSKIGRPRTRDGVYVFNLDPCHTYNIEYQLDGENVKEQEFEVPCLDGYHEYNIETLYLDLEGNVVEHVEPVEDTKKIRWRVLLNGLPLDKTNAIVSYLDDNGNLIYAEDINNQGYFVYHKLEPDQDYIFSLKVDDPSICNKTEMILYDENGEKIGKTVQTDHCKFIYKRNVTVVVDTSNINIDTNITVVVVHAEPVNYEKYYKYNVKDISLSEGAFQKFIKGIGKLVEANGKASITIESSASNVPTKTYGTNENLAQKRAQSSKEKILNALAKYKIDVSKVSFEKIDSLVQGPEYNKDAYTNQSKYEPYQYVKIRAK